MKLVIVLLGMGCLAGGYSLAGIWPGAALAVGLAAGWAVTGRFRWPWLPSALLAVTLAAAVGGVLLGVPAQWMIPAAAVALATWELAGQCTGMRLTDPAEAGVRRHAERLLAVSVGLGLIAAELLLWVRLSIPFGVLLLAAVLAFAGLFGFFQMQKSRRDQN